MTHLRYEGDPEPGDNWIATKVLLVLVGFILLLMALGVLPPCREQ